MCGERERTGKEREKRRKGGTGTNHKGRPRTSTTGGHPSARDVVCAASTCLFVKSNSFPVAAIALFSDFNAALSFVDELADGSASTGA